MNLLDLPEIRNLVAYFLDRKDSLACMRVSRDWFNDFVAHVWHTVDLTEDKRFVGLSPQVLDKYGHCVRQVFNIITFDQVKALLHPKLNQIQSMSVVNHINPYHRALELNIIRRNNATLTELVFRGPTPQPDTLVELRNRNENYFEPSILSTCFTSSPDTAKVKSHLTSLSPNRVCFTHEGFTAILRNSPVLRKLKLSRVIVIHYNRDAFSVFKTSSVTSLHASLAEICVPDPGFAWTPCLLHHFPCLEEWHLAAVDRSSNWGIDDYFRDELRECCPRLKAFQFDWINNTDKLSDLLLNCIRRPESIIFRSRI